jgi:TonB family protein
MIGTLIESAAARQRRRGGSVVSVAVHTLVIGALVVGSATGTTVHRAPPRVVEGLKYVKTVQPPEPVHTANRRAPGGPSVPDPQTVALPVTAPVIDFGNVPIGLPPVDAKLFDPSAGDGLRDLARGGPLGGSPGGSPDGLGAPGRVLDARGVDRVAALVRPVPEPRYPEVLRGAHVEGRVVVRAIVDTLGRVESGSLTILTADHDAFAESVRQVATRLRFTPALVEGRKVRMLIELPFEFRLKDR